MRLTKRSIVYIVIALVIIAAITGGIILSSKWNTPLGPSLALATQTLPAAAQTEPPADKPARAENQSTNAQATPETSATPKPQPLCGGPEVMYVLGIATDNATCKDKNCYYSGLADVIKIARIDFVTPKITVLSLPRDLYVPVPGISKRCQDLGVKPAAQLNQAYFYGTIEGNCYDGAGYGVGLLADTIYQNFGIPIDHYGVINYTAFTKIIDAVGGIDIYLPEPVDGRPLDPNDERSDMGVFEAGQPHMSGEKALRFARARKRVGGDLKREENQNKVICALKKKALSPAVLPGIPQIVSSLVEYTLTDLTPAQTSQLLCLAPQIKKENLIFGNMPTEILQATKVPYSGDVYKFGFIADPDSLRKVAADFMAGTWPIGGAQSENTCPDDEPLAAATPKP